MAAAAARAGGDEPIIDNDPKYMGKLRNVSHWCNVIQHYNDLYCLTNALTSWLTNLGLRVSTWSKINMRCFTDTLRQQGDIINAVTISNLHQFQNLGDNCKQGNMSLQFLQFSQIQLGSVDYPADYRHKIFSRIGSNK